MKKCAKKQKTQRRCESQENSSPTRLISVLEHVQGRRGGAGDLVIIETKNGRNLKSGQKLEVRFDPASALLFDGSGQRIY
jgi:lactose/L-arabinose transport system ATP-binding protein